MPQSRVLYGLPLVSPLHTRQHLTKLAGEHNANCCHTDSRLSHRYIRDRNQHCRCGLRSPKPKFGRFTYYLIQEMRCDILTTPFSIGILARAINTTLRTSSIRDWGIQQPQPSKGRPVLNNIKISPKLHMLIWICIFLVAVHVVNIFTGYRLSRFGVVPREVSTLWTILTAPFIHGGILHLVNNLVGFITFSVLYFVNPISKYVKALVFISLVSGLLVWLFGRTAMHYGLSGVVYGLWSLCIATAWFERKPLQILVAVVVIIFYSGIAIGMLPIFRGVSFEGHLAGAIAGILFAYLNKSMQKSNTAAI